MQQAGTGGRRPGAQCAPRLALALCRISLQVRPAAIDEMELASGALCVILRVVSYWMTGAGSLSPQTRARAERRWRFVEAREREGELGLGWCLDADLLVSVSPQMQTHNHRRTSCQWV